MKHLLKMTAGTIVIFLAVMACKKDDKKSTPKNYFKIGDKTYTVANASMENWGLDTDTSDFWVYDGYNIDLALFSSGLTLQTTSSGYLNVLGKGQILYFELYSTSGTNLDNGDFTFDPSSGPYQVGTFDYCDYSLTWDETNSDNDWIPVSSGKITITRNGNDYELTFDCQDIYGTKVTGHFAGTFHYFNYETILKSTAPKAGKIFRGPGRHD